jgi:anti-sigma factor RsiW
VNEPRTHAELEDLLGAYALNALDPDEVAAVDRHLADCPRCRAEVADHREVAALLASGGPAPDGLWDRIAVALEEPPPDIALDLPGTGERVAPMRSSRRRSVRASTAAAAAVLAAAAAILVAVLAVGVVRLDREVDRLQGEIAASSTLDAAALAALASPNAETVALESDDGTRTARAAILPDGVGYLVASDVPELDRDRTYQLWGINGDVVYSLGVLGTSFDVAPFVASGDLDALVITEEVAGGVAQSRNPPALQGEVA